MGPVEQTLRVQLQQGPVFRRAARHLCGPLAGIVLDDSVYRGICSRKGDCYALRADIVERERTEGAARQARRAERLARAAELERRRVETDARMRALQAQDAERDELRRRLAQAKTPEQRDRIAEESRVLALAGRALAKVRTTTAVDTERLGSLFGIDIDAGA